jgi:hypothetical protein
MLWVQTGGAPVALDPSARVANPAFEAPKADGRALTFELRVTDRHGLRGVDSVVVTVTSDALAPREEAIPIRGEVSVARAGRR